MKKFLNVGMAVFLLTLFSCSISEDSVSGDKGAIVLKATMDDGVVLKTIARSTSAVGYFLTITGNGYGYGPEPLTEGTTKIDELDPGTYTITLAENKLPVTLPAYNTPVYSTTVTEEVLAGEVTQILLKCTQDNVGIKFVFDESATSVYPELKVKIEDDDNESLEYGRENAEKQPNPDIAHFKAPSELKISLTNNGTPIKIKGKDYVTITTAKKELWTITFKTSKEEPGSIEIVAEVDKETDPKDEEWGIGGVKGRGTYLNPYSVPGAINMLPAQGVWVKGIVIGEATVSPLGRSDNTYMLIGKKTGAAEKDCIVAVIPKESEIVTILTEGRTVLIQGDIKGAGAGFTSDAVAVMDGITTGEVAKTLKDFDFTVGFAIMKGAPLSETGSDYVNILKSNAKRVSAENSMKPRQIWKGIGDYNFTEADKIVNFARANGMTVHGHTLVWQSPNDVPLWLQQIPIEDKTREQWTELLKTYITDVATHFKGKVESWDVVNEIKWLTEADGEGNWLSPDDFWVQRVGKDYIKIAFETARAADPNAKLFYNDFDLEYEKYATRRNGIYAFLTMLRAEGVPIDGVGLQFHIDMWYDVTMNLSNTLQMASDFGLVHISELDIRMEKESELLPSDYTRQANMYGNIFKAFKALDEAKQYGLTIWGVVDEQSYSDKFPLLFNIDDNGNYQPKEAYTVLLGLIE